MTGVVTASVPGLQWGRSQAGAVSSEHGMAIPSSSVDFRNGDGPTNSGVGVQAMSCCIAASPSLIASFRPLRDRAWNFRSTSVDQSTLGVNQMRTQWIAIAVMGMASLVRLSGQTFGDISGEIRDTSGASIAAAQVTVIKCRYQRNPNRRV